MSWDFSASTTDTTLVATGFTMPLSLVAPHGFSLSCWARPANASDWMGHAEISIDASGNNRVTLEQTQTSATFRYQPRLTSTTATVETVNTFVADTWNHMCGISHAGNDHEAILNGDIANRGTSATALAGSVYNFNQINVGLGPAWFDTLGTTGQVAELAIYNTALLQSDALRLNQGESPLAVRPDALVFYRSLRYSVIDTPVVGPFWLRPVTGAVVSGYHPDIFPVHETPVHLFQAGIPAAGGRIMSSLVAGGGLAGEGGIAGRGGGLAA